MVLVVVNLIATVVPLSPGCKCMFSTMDAPAEAKARGLPGTALLATTSKSTFG